MYELVRVGHDQLVGEIIRLEGGFATIQVRVKNGDKIDLFPIEKSIIFEIFAVFYRPNTRSTFNDFV